LRAISAAEPVFIALSADMRFSTQAFVRLLRKIDD